MRLVLVGSGGHAGDVLGLVEDLRKSSRFRVDRVVIAAERLDMAERFLNRGMDMVLGEEEGFTRSTHFVSAKGYPDARREAAERAISFGLEPCAPLIHPTGNISEHTIVDVGSVVLGLSSVSPGVRVGRHCYISHGALIGHDTQVGDYTSIMPGASVSGGVTIGEGVLIGAGAVVLENLSIGQRAKVAAGAVVVKDVQDGEVVMGVPAKVSSRLTH